MIDLHFGDCLDVMQSLPSDSVDLVLCDPPYGTVKGIAARDGLAMGMKGRTDWDTALDPVELFSLYSEVLRPNGVLVLFSQEPYTSKMITSALPGMPFSYRLVWIKDHFANALLAKKAPVSYFEDVLVFSKSHAKHDFEGFHPLREYAESVKNFIGKTKREILLQLGDTKACHFFRTDSTQFSLCTEHTYNRLCSFYGLESMPGFLRFPELQTRDKEYREGLIAEMNARHPKVFNLAQDKKFKSNVLNYKKDYSGDHPTQKPVALLADLIRTYSNEGDTVLDNCMGSGSTGVAAIREGRKFIGIELDATYYLTACDRIYSANK